MPQATKHIRVLVAEDEESVRALLERVLQRHDYEARVVARGDAAIGALQEDPSIALLLSDVMMPGADGLSLAAWVRRHRPELPVVLMSALAQTTDLIDGYAAGAQYYVTKPLREARLIQVLDYVSGRSDEAPPHEIEGRGETF